MFIVFEKELFCFYDYVDPNRRWVYKRKFLSNTLVHFKLYFVKLNCPYIARALAPLIPFSDGEIIMYAPAVKSQ